MSERHQVFDQIVQLIFGHVVGDAVLVGSGCTLSRSLRAFRQSHCAGTARSHRYCSGAAHRNAPRGPMPSWCPHRGHYDRCRAAGSGTSRTAAGRGITRPSFVLVRSNMALPRRCALVNSAPRGPIPIGRPGNGADVLVDRRQLLRRERLNLREEHCQPRTALPRQARIGA